MNSQTLTLSGTTWTITFSFIVILLTAGVCIFSWRRAQFSRWFGLLEVLRFGIIVLAALLLNQPEWVQRFRPDIKPSVAVLYDDSISMSTRDVEIDASQVVTRRDSIAALTKAMTWEPLRETMQVVVEPFGGESMDGDVPMPGSDLSGPLQKAAEKQANLRAVVLVSDGDWNTGGPPVHAAKKLRLANIPVYTIAVGSKTKLPDVELLTLDAPTFGVAGKAVRIPFTVESSLPRDFVSTVTLSVDGEVLTKEVRVAAMSRTTDAVTWKAKETGDYSVTLNIGKHRDETLSHNNELTAPLSIRNENLKVLLVESYPRWEYRYLRNALSRDPGVEVSCLLFHPKLNSVGGGSADYIKAFPESLEELSQFDVVFLGDVGLDDGQLTPEQCRLLKGLVEFQASGLVFLPGWQGRQHTLLETELRNLYPVVLDDDQPDGWGARTPGHFELTDLGRRSLLTKLADTQDDNISVWENLPGFQWYAPVLRSKAGCEVLAVHQGVLNEHGRLPLLVTRTYGSGKILFMGTDGAWRWREGVEDEYHYRFWGQVVRWMAYQRNMAKGGSMRFHFTPDQPRLQQTLSMHANVMENSGEPLPQGDVTVRITSPSGEVETVRLSPAGEDKWGVFRGRYTAREPGRHAVKLYCKQTSAELDASFFVQGDHLERIGKPARPDVLAEISRVTKGATLAADDVSSILRTLQAIPKPPFSVKRTSLWSHPLVVFGMVALLGAFWIGRKAGGLI